MNEQNVEFETDTLSRPTSSSGGKILYSRFEPSDKPPKLVQILIKSGLVKSESSATYFLLAIFIILVVLALYLFIFFNPEKNSLNNSIEIQNKVRRSLGIPLSR